MRGLSKTFSGVTVLDDARLTLEPGEIHALVGQNGSGKSTLIKLISGVHRADHGGEILVDGVHLGPPVHAGRLHGQGLAFVHQDLGLVPDLSVRENVRVGLNAVGRFTRRVDKAADRAAVRRTFEFLGVPIDPEATVASLTPSERVAVAVARALQDREAGSGVIVFDESSRAIPHEALPAFYEMVRFVADQGTSVLFVSHDLKEVLALAHRVTALRNGRVVETGVPVSSLDEAALTRLVLGRDGAPGDLIGQHPPRPTGTTVDITGVRGGRVHDFTTSLHGGEVVGVTGTIDSGLLDLPALLGGATPATGSIAVDGTELDLAQASVLDLLEAKVVMIPQDRHGRGLATDLTVEENITIPHVGRRSHAVVARQGLAPPGDRRRPREVRRTPARAPHRRRHHERRQPAEGHVRQMAAGRAAPAHARGAHPGRGRRRPRRAARGDPPRRPGRCRRALRVLGGRGPRRRLRPPARPRGRRRRP